MATSTPADVEILTASQKPGNQDPLPTSITHLDDDYEHIDGWASTPNREGHTPVPIVPGPGQHRDPNAVNPVNRMVLLLRPTGAGKSTFIARATGLDAEVGHSIDSCTRGCTMYECHEAAGVPLTLIDSPGFNDTHRDDLDVLDEIIRFLCANHQSLISGILYFHNITEKRVTGSAALNLRLLKALSGKEFFPHVIFVSTMWDRISDGPVKDECYVRERQLMESPRAWSDMIKGGSGCCQFLGDRDSGLHILRQFNDMPPPDALPWLIRELRDGTEKEYTSVWKIITQEREKRDKKLREELEEQRLEELEEQEIERAEAEKLRRRRARLEEGSQAGSASKLIGTVQAFFHHTRSQSAIERLTDYQSSSAVGLGSRSVRVWSEPGSHKDQVHGHLQPRERNTHSRDRHSHSTRSHRDKNNKRNEELFWW